MFRLTCVYCIIGSVSNIQHRIFIHDSPIIIGTWLLLTNRLTNMSTRFYPRFVKGNPQLRIFLPDWKMVMLKPTEDSPDNIMTFKVDPRMTDWDVKNYLEKIYRVNVAAVKSVIRAGELKRIRGGLGLTKGDDYKIVNVTLPMGEKFEWPDLFPPGKFQDMKKEYDSTLKEISKSDARDPNSKIPSWFV